MSNVPFRFEFDLDNSDHHDEPEASTSSNTHTTEPNHDMTAASNPSPRPLSDVPFRLISDLRGLFQSKKLERDALEFVKVAIVTTGDNFDHHCSSIARPLRRVHSTTVNPRFSTEASTLESSSRENADDSDLVSGVYEGGLKVWECSVDLCRYLAANWTKLGPDNVYMKSDDDESKTAILKPTTTTVLELGCGHGLPGCLLLRHAVEQSLNLHVLFADFNDYVLRDVTLCNIVLNTPCMTDRASTEGVLSRFTMGAGDWKDMSEQLVSGRLGDVCPEFKENSRFDVLLAAETTYTVEAARDTALLMARHLEPETGIGLVATKRYYFGVGGGADAFRNAVAEQNHCDTGSPDGACLEEYRLSMQVVESVDDGASNIRDLLKVQLLRKKC